MSGVEALARALDPGAYDMFGTFYQREVATLAARRILANPAPLLAALAEAGVLEWTGRQAEYGRVRDLYAAQWKKPADD